MAYDLRKTDGVFTEIQGMKTFLPKLDRALIEFEAAAEFAVSQTVNAFYEAVYKNISATTLSLEDLSELDHPYAKRHPSILPVVGHTPLWLVHTRGGVFDSGSPSMRETLKRKVIKQNRNIIGIVGWYDSDAPPYVPAVLFGSRKMHSRNVLVLSFKHNELRETYLRNIVKYINKAHPLDSKKPPGRFVVTPVSAMMKTHAVGF